MTDPTGSAGRGRLAEVLATRGGRAEPEAPFVIEHREALIYMLCQAAELEHGIMASTCSRRPRSSSARTRGSRPRSSKPSPAGATRSATSPPRRCCTFMFLERPEGMALEGAKGIDAPVHEAVPLMAEGDIVPQLQDFATVGHLYRSIEQGLVHLADKFGERNTGAVLRAHGGDRRAACDAGARGRHADGRRARAARGADHDAAGRTGVPGAQRGAELRALLRGRRPPCLIGNPPGRCSRSACVMPRPSAVPSSRTRRSRSRPRSDLLRAR
jgi:hypothetical protein